MSRYSDQIRDEYGRLIPGVSIYVYKWDAYAQAAGDLEILTDDSSAPLGNPLTSDDDGLYYFNSADGQKLLEYHYGGKVQERSLILVGALPVPQATFAGLFVNAAALTIPVGMDIITTTGYASLDVGAAVYTSDAAVNSAYVAANPHSSFIELDGRGFRLSLEQDITPEMLGATGLGVADDYPAFAATINLLPAIGGTISVLGGTYNLLTEPTWGTKVIRWNISPDAVFTGAGTGAGKFPDTARPSFVMGRSAAIGGSKAKVDFVIDDSRAPVENLGALWASIVRFARAVGKVFVAADGAASAPVVAFLSYVRNAGSPADAVSNMQVAEATTTGASVFGGNTIVFSSGGVNNCKLIGWEIDVQPQAGTTPSSAAGLIINGFTSTLPGPAIYFDGVFGGKWSTGINVGNLSDIGAGIAPASGNPRMGTLLDSGTAQYQIAAIKLNNTHKVAFYGSAGTLAAAAKLYVDGSDFFHHVMPTAGSVFRNNADTVSLVAVTDNSSNGRININGASGELQVNGTKVLGARDTGWAADTGTAKKTANATYTAGTTLTYSAAYVQSEQTAMATRVAALELVIQANSQTIKALKDAWLTHGGIGA